MSRTEDRAIRVELTVSAKPFVPSDLHHVREARFVARPLPLEGMLHDSGSSMKHLAVLFAGLAISTTALQAQTVPSGVPESHRPPPGMCRIWIDGVPPTHQPAPTDCATAIRKRPMNARVVFGSDAPQGSARTFAPMQPAPSNFATPQSQSAPSRDDQERQRIEAQRQHDEQEKRNTRPPPPPPPPPARPAPPAPRAPEHSAPPRTHVEKAPRPPLQSYSPHRPR